MSKSNQEDGNGRHGLGSLRGPQRLPLPPQKKHLLAQRAGSPVTAGWESEGDEAVGASSPEMLFPRKLVEKERRNSADGTGSREKSGAAHRAG